MADYLYGFTLEYVNYWGLVEGKQIMFCKKQFFHNRNKMFLWCKQDRKSKYKLSSEGEDYNRSISDFDRSWYVADVEFLWFYHSSDKLWTVLYEEKLFPFWDIKGGPMAYFGSIIDRKYIVLYKVYKIDVAIEKTDVKRGYSAKLVNTNKLQMIKQVQKQPIMRNVDYERKRNRIIEIIADFKEPIPW